MAENIPPTNETPESQPPAESSEGRLSIQRVAVLVVGVLGGIIVVIFLIGLGLAIFTEPTATAARIQIIRDTFLIIMLLEGLMIVGALAVLVLQVGRLVNLLQNKSTPILENTQEAVDSAKGTVEFVGKAVTEPLVKAGAFMAGVRVLIREVGGIRRAIRPEEVRETDDGDTA